MLGERRLVWSREAIVAFRECLALSKNAHFALIDANGGVKHFMKEVRNSIFAAKKTIVTPVAVKAD